MYGVRCRLWGVGCGLWAVGSGLWGVGCRLLLLAFARSDKATAYPLALWRCILRTEALRAPIVLAGGFQSPTQQHSQSPSQEHQKVRFHPSRRIIHKLGFNQKYRTFTLILLVKFVMRSKFH